MSLLDQIASTLRQRIELPRGARVLAAVSGGGDSVALAWLLLDLAGRGVLELAGIAHLNHQLRGPEADADEVFCRDLAGRMGVPFDAGQVDVARLARVRSESLEAAGRRARYEWLAQAARRLDAAWIATGHTLDDQAETVLLRLLRGAGSRGLSGIRPRRGAIIRPLLECRRAELREWLGARGEAYRDDPSNADVRIARNRVRHELLPVIDRMAPGGVVALGRAARLAADDEAWLDHAAAGAGQGIARAADGAVTLDRTAIAALPVALGRRIVRRAVEFVAPVAAHRLAAGHIDAVLALAAGRAARHADIPGVVIDVAGPQVVIRPQPPPSGPVPVDVAPLTVPGRVSLPGLRCVISAELRDQMPPPGVEEKEGILTAIADAVALQAVAPLTVRTRRPGDRIKPIGAPGRKKLQDLFVDRKVPRADRDRVPVVVDRDGRLVWVAGVAVADEYRATAASAEVVVLTAERQ